MPGLAQKLYLERSGKPICSNMPADELSAWPLLEQMVHAKQLHVIDCLLAKRMFEVSGIQHPSEASATLLCHLSQAMRLGHLCLKIQEEQIFPPVEDVWEQEDQEARSRLHQLILEGMRTLPAQLVHDISSVYSPPCAPLCKNGNRLYMQKSWALETAFIHYLKAFSKAASPPLKTDPYQIEQELKRLQQQGQLLPEQTEAILQASKHAFTIIMGGPGTGKTYTAGILIRTLLACLDSSAPCRILLAAPTGKAAANLEASIRRALQGAPNNYTVSTQTLHSVLHIPKNRSEGGLPKIIPADIVCVDEASMIDVAIMGKLMSALLPGTRLMMLGDPAQLPPVEAGSLFAEMITAFKTHRERHSSTCVVQLNRCLRTESEQILSLADSIKEGIFDEGLIQNTLEKTLESKDPSPANCVRILSCQNLSPAELQKKLLNHTVHRFPEWTGQQENPLQLLHAYSKFRILTPMRTGCLGVEELNKRFYAFFKAATANRHSS